MAGNVRNQFHQHPVAVDRRMPVVTAVESRMQVLRSLNVGGVIDHVIRLVWVFLGDTLQREPREA